MKRRAALINLVERLKIQFPREFEGVDMNAVEIYIDVTTIKNRDEIVEIIRSPNNRNIYRKIIWLILNNKTDAVTYRKERDSVTAMKFRQKGQPNTRLYCLDIPATRDEKRKVVMARVFWNKTSNANNKKNDPDIDAVSKYEYKFFKNPDEAREHRERS